jgi:membrane-bound ClpP family serine protease
MEWYITLALILVAFGIALHVAEFFMPTGGILIVVALAGFAIAVGLVFMYGTFAEGIAAILALCIGLPVLGAMLFYGWQRMSLKPGLDSETRVATVADDPAIASLDKLRGRYGRTVSPMRPAGIVEIDGRRVDAMSEGLMIEENVWVRCIDIRGGTVIVRQVESPKDLENLDLSELK